MQKVHVIDEGWIDRRDSAFPLAAILPNGDLLCSFSVGGGPDVQGGSDWARSTDGGRTWMLEGTLLPPAADPPATNALKLTYDKSRDLVLAYGGRHSGQGVEGFAATPVDGVLCRSQDRGQTWSAPEVLPFPPCPSYEISHGILVAASGRWLAPAATLPAADRLGERVLLLPSDDGGRSWGEPVTAFADPHGRHGFFEHKFACLPDGRLLGICWTVTLGEVEDRENHFAISEDDGATWSEPQPTGIRGQTMCPLPLDDRHVLLLYNRRYGRQAIVAVVADIGSAPWELGPETLLYDAGENRERSDGVSGVDEFDAFAFGFPTARHLPDGAILATYWAKAEGRFGVRWARLGLEENVQAAGRGTR